MWILSQSDIILKMGACKPQKIIHFKASTFSSALFEKTVVFVTSDGLLEHENSEEHMEEIEKWVAV